MMCHLLRKRSLVKIRKIVTMNYSKKEWMSQNECYAIPRSHIMHYMEGKKRQNRIYNVLCIFLYYVVLLEFYSFVVMLSLALFFSVLLTV